MATATTSTSVRAQRDSITVPIHIIELRIWIEPSPDGDLHVFLNDDVLVRIDEEFMGVEIPGIPPEFFAMRRAIEAYATTREDTQ